MTPERWKRVEEVFESALEQAPEEQSAFVKRACEGDESLCRQVETLIASYKKAGRFIETPALPSSQEQTLIDDSGTPLIGRRVGSYKIVREIGRGGMGSVYLAVRADDAYQKRVAIKLIKRGMDTDFIIRRFRNERQILASLDHPYVARLLDGGTTKDGLPYFVMEYVEGQPIHHYCETQKLSIAERLELFRKVCAAVQFAHQNLIIHRDLKPSNILVTADGTPKLLDFGIAKILNPEIASQTLDPTTAALRMMTPEYASPEQVRGESATGVSDVYTLGVMLYELLTDHRPYQLRSRLPYEIALVICEQEPERPSIAVNQIEVLPSIEGAPPLEITPESVSRARNTTPEQLRRQLSGNLDNIILKALRKEPQRRYQSVEELSEDIRRYLEGLPVSALPHFPSAVRSDVATDEPTTGGRSIAVLPFKVLRVEEKSDEFLGMGLTDAIITKLSNIHRIMVRPTSSVLKYYDGEHSAQVAGYELNVGFVLDGRIQRAGRRVRVTVQLVRVSDGAPFWATKFDEDFTDIFAVEDSISSQVAEALVPRMTGEEREALNKRETENASAYQAYLKGRYNWNKFTDDALGEALEFFQEAIRLDPNYAMAYVGIAEFYIWAGIYHRLAPKDCYPQAKAAAIKALQIDESLAEAHAALAFAMHCYDWDRTRAEQMFKRAIELNPNYAGAHQWYSILLTSAGRFDEGQKEIRRAVEINPLSLIDLTLVCWNLYQAGEFDQAIAEAQKIFELDKNFGLAYIPLSAAYERRGMLEEAIAAGRKAASLLKGAVIHLWALGHALAVAGRPEEAREILAEMHRLSKENRYVSAYHSAIIHAGLGEREEAFNCLEKAYEDRDSWMLQLGTEPKLAELRSDPRYADLIGRIGLRAPEESRRDELKVETGETPSGQTSTSLRAGISATSAQPLERPPSQTDEVRASHTTSVEHDERKLGRRRWLFGLAALIVLAIVGYGLFRLLQSKPVARFQSTSTVKLTASGNVTGAAISPDGKYAAYSIDEAGKQGLWVRQIAVASNLRIVPPAEVDYRGLTFSRDGTYVYYVADVRNGARKGRLYQVPAFGGSVREVTAGVDSPVGFSPDGKRLAFVRSLPAQGEEALIVANDDGSGEEQLVSRKFPEHLSTNAAPVWSPDGKRIAYAVQGADAGGFYMKVAEARIEDRAEKIISPQRWLEVGQLDWLSDGSGLVITAQSEDSAFIQLWHLSDADGQARRIINDLSDYRGVSLSADSRSLLTVQRQTFTSIWVSANGDANQSAQITASAGRYFDLTWTPDGHVLYASDASGNADIWEIEADGTNQRQVTAGAGRNYGPVASPDGSYILFHSTRSGTWQIWRMNRDGSNPVALTSGEGESNWAQVSPDGRWVIYQHVGAGTLANLWKVSIDGGTPERLTTGLSMRPAISPDGKRIAYWQKEQTPTAPWRIAVVPFEGGPPLNVFDVPQSIANGNSVLHWSQDSNSVIYIDLRGGVANLLSQPMDGNKPVPLTNFTKDQFYAFDLSPDGRLVLARGLRTNDAVLINEVK